MSDIHFVNWNYMNKTFITAIEKLHAALLPKPDESNSNFKKTISGQDYV